MDKLKLALIGCGMIVEEGHLPAWKRLQQQVEIVAIADKSPKRLQIIGDEIGLANHVRYESYYQMLHEMQLDFVDIALPHHLHKDAVLASCETQTNVLLEKPVALDMTGVHEIVSAVRNAGIRFSMIHNYMTIPLHQAALQVVADGIVHPFLVRSEAVWTASWPGCPDGDSAGWRSSRASGTLGAIHENAYHNLYLAEAYMGSAVTSVQASTIRTEEALTGENIACITLKHENGGVSIIQAGFGIVHFQRCEEIHGSEGSLQLSFDNNENPLTYYDRCGNAKCFTVEGEDDWGFNGWFQQYLNYLNGDLDCSPASVEKGLHISSIIDAAYRSAQNACSENV